MPRKTGITNQPSHTMSRSDLHNHKMNAIILSIYDTNTAYLHAKQNNRLFSLGWVHDLDCGLQKKVAWQYKCSKNLECTHSPPKTAVDAWGRGGDEDNSVKKCGEWGTKRWVWGDRERTCGEGRGRGRFPSQCRSPLSKTESGQKACRRLPQLVYMVTCTDHAQMYVQPYTQTQTGGKPKT